MEAYSHVEAAAGVEVSAGVGATAAGVEAGNGRKGSVTSIGFSISAAGSTFPVNAAAAGRNGRARSSCVFPELFSIEPTTSAVVASSTTASSTTG